MTGISIPDKILYLKRSGIFEDLSIGELAAVASVAEVVDYPLGEIIIQEGESNDNLYLIVEGEVSVVRNPQGKEGSKQVEVELLGIGDPVGEMTFSEDNVCSTTFRTRSKCRLLAVHKGDFTDIVKEYPQIGLNICKEFCKRLRKLYEKLEHCEN